MLVKHREACYALARKLRVHLDAKISNWTKPTDIKRVYRTASVLPGNRIVFNIKGNRYRLVVNIHYKSGIVHIRFVGTHQEYNRIDATSI